MRASLEQLSGVLALIHQAAVSPEGWPRVLRAIARLYDAQEASILDLRAFHGTVFDGSGKQLLELVAPHLEIARQVKARLSEALAARDSIAAGLDRFSDAAFILEESMKIRHLNAAASRLLAADRRVRGAAGRLWFAEPRLNSAYQSAVRAAAAELPRSRVFGLPATAEGGNMELTVCPLQDHHPLSSQSQPRLVLVVLSARRRAIAAIVSRMQQIYGLTVAEAHVIALLACGRSIDEIAAARRVRHSTLRAQLKSIRAKTGVARQAELVRLALAGAPIEIRAT